MTPALEDKQKTRKPHRSDTMPAIGMNINRPILLIVPIIANLYSFSAQLRLNWNELKYTCSITTYNTINSER